MFDQFVINYNMHAMDKSIMELHRMLQTTEHSSRSKTRETSHGQQEGGRGKLQEGQRLQEPWARPRSL